ncbi:hypothetical protein CNMCM8980_001133 [Aspergillus fumigatiaffinis]|uniref:Photolyase/cryptochrome alpha/beta domain-containing protein n=1 Tax=Aspergillus fumigatiaffinis TaxID=340414 RepID=A0A8H4H246_9EURO|nr:hypothetical protein CNMCM6457_009495 [Aspergillus fumigatiaffinis]KAF4233053.1 hypothetical protein CNMCM6805_009538 [Aspergillus fumigatiaffinis]KAF4240764.1 hypothetical protein CNMCM8980_001133 [Aspergillus fumigatiaffinis]
MQEDRLQPQSYLHGGHRTMRSEPSIGSDQIDVASPNQPLMQRSRQQGIGSVKETQVTYNQTRKAGPVSSASQCATSEEFSIVLREFYPPDVSDERCHAYNDERLERPTETLQRAYEETADQRGPSELTVQCPARVDLILRTLHQLKGDLSELDIPLYMETQGIRRTYLPQRVVDLCQQWGANHLYANLEYVVDELRREARPVKLCVKNGIKLETAHDACVVPPGQVTSRQGPGSNLGDARKYFKGLFDSEVPATPENKKLSEKEKQQLSQLYPAGEYGALRRLEAFLEEKGRDYAEARNMVCGQTTSILSPYFASGWLSARTSIEHARRANKGSLHGDPLVWFTGSVRLEFTPFREVPHMSSMNKCFKPEFTNLEWEYDETKFAALCEGKTGSPVVDAAMRQVKHDKWMHNRTRMIIASFLSKDLLIDWRRGERYFMETLIDGDFATNHGGFGFGSGIEVDPQPYFRSFNPLRQSVRLDPDGEYLCLSSTPSTLRVEGVLLRHRYTQKWVPELREMKGAAIHEPRARGAGAIAEKNGYPRPMVDHPKSRDQTLHRSKRACENGR